VITLEHVSISYEDNQVLQDINTQFKKSSFTSIIGINGSGKSTLMRSIAGLQPYQGKIFLDGIELREHTRKERAKKMAYLPQTRQVPHMDVLTMVAHGRFPHLMFNRHLSEKDKEMIDKAISVTNIQTLLNRKVSELSGGERQRVYLAMAITQNADIFLFDEPTTYLDIRFQLEIIDILRTLNHQGKTIIMAVHDLQQAFSYADTVCLIHQGDIVAKQSPQDLYKSQSLQEIFNVLLTPTNKDDSKQLYGYQLSRRNSLND